MDSNAGHKGYKILLPYMEIEVVSDDIVRFRLTKDTNITMAMSTEMLNICQKLFPDKTYKSLKIVNYKMTLDADVMDFLASNARIGITEMEAVVVNTATLKFLGNFYLKIKRPVIKTKVFDSEAEAMNWLENFGKQAIKSTKEANG